MRRYLVSPKWWAGHLLVAALATGCVLLGLWQFDRAQAPGGTGQNLGYALQWPLFALFAVLGWARFLWLEEHGPRRGPPKPAASPTPPPTPRPAQEDEPDDELAAYNAYLAQLAARDRQR